MADYTFDLLNDPRRETVVRLRNGVAPLDATAIVTTSDVIVDNRTERRTTMQVRLATDIQLNDLIDYRGKRYITENQTDSPHSNSKAFVLNLATELPTLVT